MRAERDRVKRLLQAIGVMQAPKRKPRQAAPREVVYRIPQPAVYPALGFSSQQEAKARMNLYSMLPGIDGLITDKIGLYPEAILTYNGEIFRPHPGLVRAASWPGHRGLLCDGTEEESSE